MTKPFAITLFILGIGASSFAQAAFLAFANAACPHDYHVLDVKVGDIDQDGSTDLVAVYAFDGEEKTADINEKRIIEIFLDRAGLLVSQGKNQNLLYYYGYDRNFPESYVDIVIMNGTIWIEQYGGFNDRWGREVRLGYSQSKSTIVFLSDETTITRSDDISVIVDDYSSNADKSERLTWTDYDIYE